MTASTVTLLITGVNRGLGRAIASAAIARGYPLIGVVRSPEAAEQVKDLVTQGMRLFVADLSDPEAIDVLASRLSSENCTPTVLILNAGLMTDDCVDGLQAEQLKKVLATNLAGPLLLLSRLLPVLKANQGRVIAISSLSARKATDQGRVAYPASKAGLSMAFSALRLQSDLAPVRFVTVEAGRMTPQPRLLAVTYDWAASRILDMVGNPDPPAVAVFPFSARVVFGMLRMLPVAAVRWIADRRRHLNPPNGRA